jgi:hypothetical protein
VDEDVIVDDEDVDVEGGDVDEDENVVSDDVIYVRFMKLMRFSMLKNFITVNLSHVRGGGWGTLGQAVRRGANFF